MYKFEKSFYVERSHAKIYTLRVVFHPKKSGCKSVGGVVIRLFWRDLEYSSIYDFTPIFSDNYKTAKEAIQNFYNTHAADFFPEDGRRLYELLTEAFGGIVLSLDKSDLEN